MQKNLEYQGLTNALWYFTSLYGGHLWQDRDDIKCHAAKRCHRTSDRKSRGVAKKGQKGKAMEGHRREARSEAGSQRHKRGEWNFNPEQSFQKSRWMSFEIVLTSRMCFQVNMVYFRGFGENYTIASLIPICILLLEMLSNPISVLGIHIRLQRILRIHKTRNYFCSLRMYWCPRVLLESHRLKGIF